MTEPGFAPRQFDAESILTSYNSGTQYRYHLYYYWLTSFFTIDSICFKIKLRISYVIKSSTKVDKTKGSFVISTNVLQVLWIVPGTQKVLNKCLLKEWRNEFKILHCSCKWKASIICRKQKILFKINTIKIIQHWILLNNVVIKN